MRFSAIALIVLWAGSMYAQEAAQKSAVQKESAVQKSEPVPEAVQKDSAVQKAEPADVVVVGPLKALCLRKARAMAARGRVCHVGGGFGGCKAEGVGGGRTASAALNNCCFTGVRSCAASAVVFSRGQYWAVKLFW